MQTNQTPFNDQSVNTTGCCAKFNPAGWDAQELHFKDKPFVRASTLSIGHVPLNMGVVYARVQGHIEKADAGDPSQELVMSRDPSAFTGEHLFAVKSPVADEEMIAVSGEFLTKVFEGPYSAVRGWHGQMQALAREKGREPKQVWFYYTTCPDCAKAYGANPVVGLVELA
ncbi:hydrolase [Cypionkella sp.]|uniref:hydrolase n=1 Tax=Cypionkella sp. TaxID=2811411 RepID=UPI002ABBC971|nr:hydrolase [Cypionkella sp.]MDZ4394696.1 hydrolase [Cypionkella sp.]